MVLQGRVKNRGRIPRLFTLPEGRDTCYCISKIMCDRYYCIETFCDARKLDNFKENALENSYIWRLNFREKGTFTACGYKQYKYLNLFYNRVILYFPLASISFTIHTGAKKTSKPTVYTDNATAMRPPGMRHIRD